MGIPEGMEGEDFEITNVNDSCEEVEWKLEGDSGTRVFFCLFVLICFGCLVRRETASLFADGNDGAERERRLVQEREGRMSARSTAGSFLAAAGESARLSAVAGGGWLQRVRWGLECFRWLPRSQ